MQYSWDVKNSNCASTCRKYPMFLYLNSQIFYFKATVADSRILAAKPTWWVALIPDFPKCLSKVWKMETTLIPLKSLFQIIPFNVMAPRSHTCLFLCYSTDVYQTAMLFWWRGRLQISCATNVQQIFKLTNVTVFSVFPNDSHSNLSFTKFE